MGVVEVVAGYAALDGDVELLDRLGVLSEVPPSGVRTLVLFRHTGEDTNPSSKAIVPTSDSGK